MRIAVRNPLSMIDIQAVRHALLVSEHLSIRRAAAELGLRPSAVSRRLRSLEEGLGVALFERSSAGARPAGDSWTERDGPWPSWKRRPQVLRAFRRDRRGRWASRSIPRSRPAASIVSWMSTARVSRNLISRFWKARQPTS